MSNITPADSVISFPLKNKGDVNKNSLISDLAAYRSVLANIEQSMLTLRQRFGSRKFGKGTIFSITLHLWKNGKCEPQYQLRWLFIYRLPSQRYNTRLYIMTPLRISYENEKMPHHDAVLRLYSVLSTSPLFDEFICFEKQRLMLNAQVRTLRFAISELEKFLSYSDLGESL